MSLPRKSMKEIRSIFTTKLLNPTASIRFIAQATRCSRLVVKDYIDRLVQFPITFNDLQLLNNQQLATHLNLESRTIQETESNRIMSAWLAIHAKRLSEKHMTRRHFHECYLSEHHDGLHYSQFYLVLRQQTSSVEASGMFDHKAGEKLYLDFTGSKLHWRDELGTSFKEDFVYATQAAFLHLGGVPCAVVPD